MNDDSFSSKLRNLSKHYYQNHINFDEYRSSRRLLLDQIDEEFNGQKIIQQGAEMPAQSSKFMKTISFFANTDLDDKD